VCGRSDFDIQQLGLEAHGWHSDVRSAFLYGVPHQDEAPGGVTPQVGHRRLTMPFSISLGISGRDAEPMGDRGRNQIDRERSVSTPTSAS
jgi:hypothetical protein